MTKDQPTWTTKEGKELLISSMETSHIQRCISMLERKGLNKEKYEVYVRPGEATISDNDYEIEEGVCSGYYTTKFNPYYSQFLALKEELKNRGFSK